MSFLEELTKLVSFHRGSITRQVALRSYEIIVGNASTTITDEVIAKLYISSTPHEVAKTIVEGLLYKDHLY